MYKRRICEYIHLSKFKHLYSSNGVKTPKRTIFKKKSAEEVATANAVDQIISAFKKESMTVPKTLLDVSILTEYNLKSYANSHATGSGV